jgi:Ferritin-like
MTTNDTPSPQPNRDLHWIKGELQSAIELEWSTLPVYLSALFSLEVQRQGLAGSVGTSTNHRLLLAIRPCFFLRKWLSLGEDTWTERPLTPERAKSHRQNKQVVCRC